MSPSVPAPIAHTKLSSFRWVHYSPLRCSPKGSPLALQRKRRGTHRNKASPSDQPQQANYTRLANLHGTGIPQRTTKECTQNQIDMTSVIRSDVLHRDEAWQQKNTRCWQQASNIAHSSVSSLPLPVTTVCMPPSFWNCCGTIPCLFKTQERSS